MVEEEIPRIIYKCPKCGGTRSSSGNVGTIRKVWTPCGNDFSPSVLAPSPTWMGFIPLMMRAECISFNRLCYDGFEISAHVPHAVENPCVLEYVRCRLTCRYGILVL